MDCTELVYSNDYFDFIVERTELPGEVCVQELTSTYKVAYYPRNGLGVNLELHSYTAVPQCYTTLEQEAMEASGIAAVQNQSALQLKGLNVLMGFVDTGIDAKNPLFQYSDSTTRIVGIWDQQDETGTPPEGFLYGAEYDEEEINRRLESGDRLPRDEEGHGTYVAGLAAGGTTEIERSGNVAGEPAGERTLTTEFTGAAPLSRIAVVRLKQAKQYLRDFYHIPDGVPCYQENDIMAGVRYLDLLAARLNMPLVICIALGTNMGNHGGTGPLSELLADVGAKRGRCVVTAAGSEAGARHHFAGNVQQDESAVVEIRVDRSVRGFTMEMWAQAPQILNVSVMSPSGEAVPALTRPRQVQQRHQFILEATTLTIDYRLVGTKSGDQLIFFNFDNPASGIWKIYVTGEVITNGKFNCWLPITQFLSGSVIFTQSIPDTTVTNPGNSAAVITAGAYNTRNNSLYLESGRGFNVQGAVKPDLVAPGVEVLGPGIAGSFTLNTGTSPAAAITAGAAALYMEWSYRRQEFPNVNTVDTRSFLIRGAGKPGVRAYPNSEWGYGTLNLYEAFLNLRA